MKINSIIIFINVFKNIFIYFNVNVNFYIDINIIFNRKIKIIKFYLIILLRYIFFKIIINLR